MRKQIVAIINDVNQIDKWYSDFILKMASWTQLSVNITTSSPRIAIASTPSLIQNKPIHNSKIFEFKTGFYRKRKLDDVFNNRGNNHVKTRIVKGNITARTIDQIGHKNYCAIVNSSAKSKWFDNKVTRLAKDLNSPCLIVQEEINLSRPNRIVTLINGPLTKADVKTMENISTPLDASLEYFVHGSEQEFSLKNNSKTKYINDPEKIISEMNEYDKTWFALMNFNRNIFERIFKTNTMALLHQIERPCFII